MSAMGIFRQLRRVRIGNDGAPGTAEIVGIARPGAVDEQIFCSQVQRERTTAAVLCGAARGTIHRESLSACELLIFLDPSRERPHGAKRFALYGDLLRKGNGNGSGMEVRSTVAPRTRLEGRL